MRCNTLTETATLTPAETDYFAKYQSYQPREESPTDPKPDTRGYRQKLRAERLAQGYKPDQRRGSKHWTARRFRATFAEFRFRFDRKQNRQVRTALLTDVHDDQNTLITMNWIVDCPRSLAELCTHEGCVVEFEAQYSATCYDAQRAGCPMLRAPFRKVAS